MRRSRRNTGFTLIEIIIVVTILAILAGLIIPRYVGRVEEARKVKAVIQIREMMKALELYRLDNGKYPSTEQGLQALAEQPTSEPLPLKWRQYMDKIPKDPWGNDYIYLCPGTHGALDIISIGPDGKEGEDDIMSWDLPEN
ncbi:MAG: type II secretion system major pseudopilin GspG [bacterium]